MNYKDIWNPDVTSDRFRSKSIFHLEFSFMASELAPLTGQLTVLASCRNASPTALLQPQTVRPKTNKKDSARCKVTTLSTFMNRHPGSTAGLRLTGAHDLAHLITFDGRDS